MMCERCALIGLKAVYMCLDCYDDDGEDTIMCESCKNEHIDANIGNKTRFKKFTNWDDIPNYK